MFNIVAAEIYMNAKRTGTQASFDFLKFTSRNI